MDENHFDKIQREWEGCVLLLGFKGIGTHEAICERQCFRMTYLRTESRDLNGAENHCKAFVQTSFFELKSLSATAIEIGKLG